MSTLFKEKYCSIFLDFFCNRGEGGNGYFMVLNSLAETRESSRFRRFVPFQAAGSDLSKKKARKSLKQRAKKKTKRQNGKCQLAILIPFAVYK